MESAIRFFPEVLSRRGGEVAQLASMFDSFQENEGGRLLVDNGYLLKRLVYSSDSYGETQPNC